MRPSVAVMLLLFLAPIAGGAADYGRELPMAGVLGAGPGMDTVLEGKTLYFIGGGSLYVADVSDPAAPKVKGSLPGLGHVRQLEVQDGVAYVTAREDGLFVIDVSRPEKPVLLNHYDTIELATGIAVSGDVAFVACRHSGVELVDVSDPKAPKHLSTIRVGEAQSVTARDGYLYAGVWSTRELVICDVRNPRKPVRIASAALDGYGDGVAVRGNLCFAATGHHSAGREHGHGHGLEIFDVSDPAQPRHLSRIKTPPLYRLRNDMWGVEVSDKLAYLTDTYNGVFVIDISAPRRPRFLAHRQLPLVEGREDPSPAAGLAVGDGHIYVAGAFTDLHVLAAPKLARPIVAEPGRPLRVPAPEPPRPDSRYRVYDAGGQVHGVAVRSDGGLLVAAGSAGLDVVADWQRVARYPTAGFASGVAVHGERVYVAEGKGGLSVWRTDKSGRLSETGRYQAGGESVRQVALSKDGRFAALHVGQNRLHIVDVSGPRNPRLAFEDDRLGLFYMRPFSPDLYKGRFLLCQWHVTGLFLYDLLAGAGPRYTELSYPFRIGSQNGAVPWGEEWLVTRRSGYFLVKPGETSVVPAEMDGRRPAGVDLSGKPSVYGSTLFVSNRYTGRVSAVDIGDFDRPKLLGALELDEHPGIVVESGDVALVPAGYQGLLGWRYRREAR